MNSFFLTLLVSCLIAYAIAECPSACSGHGTCGAYDACTCFRNWMSNDCSERICPFGTAHVDTPLGDLDSSSGRLTGPNTKVVVNSDMYPQGTTEQFPAMKDSSGRVLRNTAHYYRECSNKGICDRSTGQCECFEGYDGSSCQRASCPTTSDGVCSGHGTCATIQELAALDNENIYRLWDEDITMGCQCDAGYTGSDCSARSCKYGSDPLYYDDYQNVRHANFTVQFYIMDDNAEIYGNYSLIFTDIHGEDWQTDPIDIDANCGVIQSRLEGLPNNVIPKGSVLCQKHDGAVKLHTVSDLSSADTVGGDGVTDGNLHSGQVAYFPDVDTGSNGALDALTGQWHSGEAASPIYWARSPLFGNDASNSGAGTDETSTGRSFNFSVVNKFTLAFPGNPGSIAPLKINRFLDGKRPTLFSTEGNDNIWKNGETLGVHIHSNGFHGENTDYVNDECEGVLVGIASDHYKLGVTAKKWTQYLTFDDDIQFQRMKRCLGDSDGIKTNNVDVYDWDFGNFMNPHLIKLVDATQDRFTEFIRADGTSYKVLAPGQTPSGGGSGSIDRNQNGIFEAGEANIWDAVPMTKLCNNQGNWVNDNYLSSGNRFPLQFQNTGGVTLGAERNLGERGWCRNYNPPGFFAIIYFDDCTANGVTRKYTVASTTPADSTAHDAATYEMCGVGRTGFRILTRPATDYKTTTRFHVYTTKGTLQQVSAHAAAYTTTYEEMYKPVDTATATALEQSRKAISKEFIHSFYSNVIHTRNTTYLGGTGSVDCETAPVTGPYGNLDCLNKGDKLFLLNIGVRDTANCLASNYPTKNIGGATVDTTNCYYKTDQMSFNSNPMYPNMYTVQKIGKDKKDGTKSESPDVVYTRFTTTVDNSSPSKSPLNYLPSDAEGYRHSITLDMGVNAMYIANSRHVKEATNLIYKDISATMYKFHPPTLATTGTTGYTYVAECSNRGICDSDTGICECFSGYTGEACGIVNSLAV